ncbi:hypothetical protein BGX23_002904 [Mortierella sp. AD031]|nr:hypothetical protein BGX23_002904 [Mortierella sp. AD031]KAG0201031.1 hypothetical protein BGX33_010632 [Mortierella sp. NVP41]
MASFPRAKVDSSTQTDPPLPFTALLDRALDRVEATVPLNLSSITFYIRRHHLSRIEQVEALLSENFFFKFVLFRVGLKPQHVYSVLCLVLLYGCRQLYRRSVYLTTNLCAVAYPAYCSIRTINSEPIAPPRELGLEPTEYAPLTSSSSRHHHRRQSSIYSSGASVRSSSGKRRSRTSLHRMNSNSNINSMVEDSMQDSNCYSSSQEDDYDSRRSVASSWGRPSDYSNYSEDNITTTSGSAIISMTVEEKMKQRMRRRWALFSQTRKDKATRQWLAYWSIYGTVQVVDTWSSFLLDWIPGYNLGKLLFLWWAQRRGATLVFDYFQPLIQSKSKDGREVARKTSNRSLNSEMSRQDRSGGSGSGGAGGSRSRPDSLQILPSTLAHQQQQQHQQYQQQQPQYQQQQFEQQFYAKGGSRRDTATFRELNQGRHRDDYDEDEEEEDDEDDFHHLHQRQQLLQQQQLQQQRQQKQHHQGSLDLLREGMTSSPHDSGSFAETSLFESAESVWSAPPVSTGIQASVDDIGSSLGGAGGLLSSSFASSAARLHSNNATPTPMSVQEQYHLRQQLELQQQQQQQQSLQKQLAMSDSSSLDAKGVADSSLHSYAVASTIHWNPSSSTDL